MKDEVKNSLPELPDDKFNRFITDYELPVYDAGVLTSILAVANYYESCLKIYNNPKTVSNWIMVELLRLIPSEELNVATSPVTPEGLCGLLQMIEEGKISGKMGKDILEQSFNTRKDPKKLVEELGLSQVSDEQTLLFAIKKILDENLKEVEKYKSGKTKVFGFFVGQIMKETKGKANPQLLNDLLKKTLDEYTI
jgi:aspartyl-tRNA(Asn)/glutamyl-tRNA(Gln) amidotransferase subunit B